MNKKEMEFFKACERGTRPVGVRVLKGRVGECKDGSWVVKMVIGRHDSAEEAEGFLETVRIMLANESGQATDYFSWGFAYAAEDAAGNSYFRVAPLDYFERYRSFDGDPSRFFHLPPALGFVHESGSIYRYGGDETEGREILLRMGLRDLDDFKD